ncbi:MAG: hypothetical protein MPJ24_06675 [Pirellulaceae bacterium]|nr:hypothetical protein [Pirellulaceae bacterium]
MGPAETVGTVSAFEKSPIKFVLISRGDISKLEGISCPDTSLLEKQAQNKSEPVKQNIIDFKDGIVPYLLWWQQFVGLEGSPHMPPTKGQSGIGIGIVGTGTVGIIGKIGTSGDSEGDVWWSLLDQRNRDKNLPLNSSISP